MPRLRIVQPQEVAAYGCDGPSCEMTCASFTGTECGWVSIDAPAVMNGPATYASHVRPGRHGQHLWFCGWQCTAEYAWQMEHAYPLLTREAVPVPPLPF